MSSQELITPTAADVQLAKKCSPLLTRLLANRKKGPWVRIVPENGDESISIPFPAIRLLNDILNEMAKGSAMTLLPIHAELTTQQAADLLNVSRPHLVEQLEKGFIPHRLVGTHRRVMLKDVLEYKEATTKARLKSLEELSELDQELGLGY